MVMKDSNSYLVNVANIETAYKSFSKYSYGTYTYLKIQVRGVEHVLSYGEDEALRDADYDRLMEAGQH